MSYTKSLLKPPSKDWILCIYLLIKTYNISTLLKNIDIDMVIFENIDIDIDIDKAILKNVDIDKEILENIYIDIKGDHKISIKILGVEQNQEPETSG